MILGSTNRIIFKPAAPSPVKLLLNKYEGAAAAYSLRLLNADYNGPAINVRHAGEGNPSQLIYFNSDGELDTETLINFCGNHNGYVTRWYDQSGNQNDATQTTASDQPKIYDRNEGLILQNEKPSLYFDGTGDSFTSSNLAGQTRLDTYFVAKPNNDDFYIYPFGGNGYGFTAVNNSTSTDLTNNYGTPSLYANSQLFTGTTLGQLHTFLNGTKLVVHQNGSTLDWLTYTFGNYVSYFYNFDGYFSEIIIYNSDQTSNQMDIENNINKYYKIY